MIQFIIGVVLGVLGLWFTAINKLRFDIYTEKLNIYKKIQELATDIHSHSVVVYSKDTDKIEKFKDSIYNLYKFTLSNALIISEPVINKVNQFCFSVDIKKLNDMDYLKFENNFDSLLNEMRRDVSIKELHNFNTFLTQIPDWIKNYFLI